MSFCRFRFPITDRLPPRQTPTLQLPLLSFGREAGSGTSSPGGGPPAGSPSVRPSGRPRSRRFGLRRPAGPSGPGDGLTFLQPGQDLDNPQLDPDGLLQGHRPRQDGWGRSRGGQALEAPGPARRSGREPPTPPAYRRGRRAAPESPGCGLPGRPARPGGRRRGRPSGSPPPPAPSCAPPPLPPLPPRPP